jgi:hypothetical protein
MLEPSVESSANILAFDDNPASTVVFKKVTAVV